MVPMDAPNVLPPSMSTMPTPPGDFSGGTIAGLANARPREDLVLALRDGSAQVTLELARVAASMATRRTWTVFGYPEPEDFARELLDRSGRWLRDLITLGKAVERLPALEAALLGCDGGPALGRVAALQISQVATPESLPAWVALARESSVRDLARAVRAAVACRSHVPITPEPRSPELLSTEPGSPELLSTERPPPEPGSPELLSPEPGSPEPAGSPGPTPEAETPVTPEAIGEQATPSQAQVAGGDQATPSRPQVIDLRAADLLLPADDNTEVRIRMPRAVAAAFEEAFELHRMAIGRSAGTGSFVEALLGEAASAGVHPDDDAPVPEGITLTTLEAWTFAIPGLENARPAGGISGAALGDPCGIDMSKATLVVPGGAAGGVIEGAADAETEGETAGQETPEAPPTSAHEAELAEVRSLWKRNIEKLDPSALEWANDLLDRIERRTATRLPAGARRLGWRLGGLLVLESEIERCIAHLLSLYPARLGPGRARGCLGAAAEELLGVSRRTLERRVGIRHALAWLPRLRHAYECGEMGMEATWKVWRILGRGPADAQLERDWLAHARGLTVRRLQDEARLVERRRHGLVEFEGEDYRQVPTDEEWFASLRTVPGATRARITILAAQARMSQDDNVFLTLRLSEDHARDFAGTIGAACRLLPPPSATEGAEASDAAPNGSPPGPRECRSGGPAGKSTPTAPEPRTQPTKPDSPCAWEGLLLLLLEFAAIWDDPHITPRRDHERIHRRHGYRCMAPGCSARATLQAHHIHFRGHCGSDCDFNLVPLCKWHHHEGPHGTFMRVAGRAPLGLTFELGCDETAATYHNDRWLGVESDAGKRDSQNTDGQPTNGEDDARTTRRR